MSPSLCVVEDKTNPRSDRYVVFVEDDDGAVILGSGPTEDSALIDAQANLAPILGALRHKTYELATVEIPPADTWGRHRADNAR